MVSGDQEDQVGVTEQRGEKVSGVQEQVDDIVAEEALDESGLSDAQVAEALEMADLSVPNAALDEVMADQLQQHLQTYHALAMQQRTARQVSDHAKAEKIRAEMIYQRTAAAIIQYKFPAARGIANETMEIEAAKAQRNRAAAKND